MQSNNENQPLSIMDILRAAGFLIIFVLAVCGFGYALEYVLFLCGVIDAY